MSFQAKRLRVQLPCGERTVFEEAAAGARAPGGGCAFPTEDCQGGTCWFQSPIACDIWSPLTRHICDFESPCYFGTPPCGGFASPCVRFGTPCPDFVSPCGGFSTPCQRFLSPCGGTECPGGSVIDPGPVLIDPEHLPALREALEAQLKEIETAEKALKKRGGKGKG
jgi:hypothetical protein